MRLSHSGYPAYLNDPSFVRSPIVFNPYFWAVDFSTDTVSAS